MLWIVFAFLSCEPLWTVARILFRICCVDAAGTPVDTENASFTPMTIIGDGCWNFTGITHILHQVIHVIDLNGIGTIAKVCRWCFRWSRWWCILPYRLSSNARSSISSTKEINQNEFIWPTFGAGLFRFGTYRQSSVPDAIAQETRRWLSLSEDEARTVGTRLKSIVHPITKDKDFIIMVLLCWLSWSQCFVQSQWMTEEWKRKSFTIKFLFEVGEFVR